MYKSESTILIKDLKPGLKHINVIFIVLKIGQVITTKENREVRNFKVADQSACINVSIWDEPGHLISTGDIIKMTKGYTSIWRNCLTLYSGKNGEVKKIDEFCMTFNEQINMSEPLRPEQLQSSLDNSKVMATAGGSSRSLERENNTASDAPTSQQPSQSGGIGAGGGSNASCQRAAIPSVMASDSKSGNMQQEPASQEPPASAVRKTIRLKRNVTKKVPPSKILKNETK